MKKYVPNRTALLFVQLLTVVICGAICYLAYRNLRSYNIIMLYAIGIFVGILLIAGVVFFPIYLIKTSYIVTEKDITKAAGIFLLRKEYMLNDSIQYITTVITPLSRLTSLNFIIINALGGKILLLFLKRNEVAEITAVLNHAIREKAKND